MNTLSAYSLCHWLPWLSTSAYCQSFLIHMFATMLNHQTPSHLVLAWPSSPPTFMFLTMYSQELHTICCHHICALSHRGHKTRTSIHTGQDFGAPLCGADCQQTEFQGWLMFQGWTCLSAEVKLKSWYCTRHWFMHLERGWTALYHSPFGNGTPVMGLEERLFQPQSTDAAFFYGSDNLTVPTSDSRVPELNV